MENGYGVSGAVNGIPFTSPKQGVEVIWNHLLRYRGESAARDVAQAAPTGKGDYTLVQFRDEFYMVYSMAGMTEAQLNNKILFFKQEVMAPARLAGGILLVQETDARLRAVPATMSQGGILGAAPGSPLLESRRVAISFRDRPVEWRISAVNTAAHDYHNTFGKGESIEVLDGH